MDQHNESAALQELIAKLDPESRTFFSEAALGRDAAEFINSRVGDYLTGCFQQDPVRHHRAGGRGHPGATRPAARHRHAARVAVVRSRSICRASWTRNSLSAKGIAFVQKEYGDIFNDPDLRQLFFYKENAARQAGDKRTHVELYKAIGDDLRKKLNRPALRRRRLLPNRLQRRRSRRSRRRKPRLLQRPVLPPRASRAERRLSSRRRARKSLRR
jgi:hypothetical protein